MIDLHDELKEALRINKNDLDFELMTQASQFHRAAEQWTLAVSLRDESKDAQKAAYATIDANIRKAIEDEGGKKPPENAIDGQVRTDPAYLLACDNQQKATARAQRWEILKDAWGQRSYMLRDLVQLYCSEYYVKSTIEGDEQRGGELKAETGRKAMAKSRKRTLRRESTK